MNPRCCPQRHSRGPILPGCPHGICSRAQNQRAAPPAQQGSRQEQIESGCPRNSKRTAASFACAGPFSSGLVAFLNSRTNHLGKNVGLSHANYGDPPVGHDWPCGRAELAYKTGWRSRPQTFPSQMTLMTDTSMARATTYTVTLFWHPPAIMFRSSLLRRYLDRTILPEHFQVCSPISRTLHPKNFSTNRIKQLARYGATVGQRTEPTRCSQHPFDTPQ